jgi:hypothetical protein
LSKLQVTYVVNGKEYQIFHVDNFIKDVQLAINEYRNGKKRNVLDTVLIPDTFTPPPPPPVEGFPIQDVAWYYNMATNTLKRDDEMLTSKHVTPFDPVFLPSGASGAKKHQIKSHEVIVDTGSGNGRIYIELYNAARYDQLPTARSVLVTTGRAIRLNGNDNHSSKFGNHGTDGYKFDAETGDGDVKAFGGWGVSKHLKEMQSKVEINHDSGEGGKEDQFPYPNGKELTIDKPYRWVDFWKADQQKNRMTLNSWIDFEDGDGFEHIVKDRFWEVNSEWNNLVKAFPDSVDVKGTPKKPLDYDQVMKGPGFIECDHVWERANKGPIAILEYKAGTVAS